MTYETFFCKKVKANGFFTEGVWKHICFRHLNVDSKDLLREAEEKVSYQKKKVADPAAAIYMERAEFRRLISYYYRTIITEGSKPSMRLFRWFTEERDMETCTLCFRLPEFVVAKGFRYDEMKINVVEYRPDHILFFFRRTEDGGIKLVTAYPVDRQDIEAVKRYRH